MEHLPFYLAVTFGFTVLLGIGIFSKAMHFSKPFLIFLIALVMVQSGLGLSGFYSDINTMTTRFPLLVMPLLIVLVSLFFTRKGKAFIDSMDIKTLTALHVIRVLVELVLLGLYIHKTIPQAMTFEGRNLDILSGLTVPLVYYFGFVKKQLSTSVLIMWNAACMLLLLNVVANAFLSLPGRFERFGFEQPNIAVGYFPYLLLPAILVPLVLFSNVAAIRQLILNKKI
jgi:hypothetical protein